MHANKQNIYWIIYIKCLALTHPQSDHVSNSLSELLFPLYCMLCVSVKLSLEEQPTEGNRKTVYIGRSLSSPRSANDHLPIIWVFPDDFLQLSLIHHERVSFNFELFNEILWPVTFPILLTHFRKSEIVRLKCKKKRVTESVYNKSSMSVVLME